MTEQAGAGGVSAWDVSDFDAVLSQGRPFGDSAYVREQMHRAVKRRMAKAGARLSAARRILAALEGADEDTAYRVLGDPVVRCAVQHALARITMGSEPPLPMAICRDVLEETAHRLEAGEVRATGPHLGDPARTPWVWDPGRADDAFGRALRQIMEREFGGGLCTPTPDEIAMLRQAARILAELLPGTSRSALSHTHVVGLTPGTGVWERKSSTSQYRTTGIIFLNRKQLTNPWWVAEHLLHESLHQKLYDFRHAHSLLAADLDGDRTPALRTVVSLWNPPGRTAANHWDPHRVFAAFHVYVHLALFSALAEQREPGIPPGCMTPSRTARERAHYLGEQLRTAYDPELGPAGRAMAKWLSAVLTALDPAPPPPGAILHLLMHRYLREAERVRKSPAAAGVAEELAGLAESELAAVRAILAVIGDDRTGDDRPGITAAATFADTRRRIAEALLRRAPDGYSLDPLAPGAKPSPDEMVREMVETSSRELAAMDGVV